MKRLIRDVSLGVLANILAAPAYPVIARGSQTLLKLWIRSGLGPPCRAWSNSSPRVCVRLPEESFFMGELRGLILLGFPFGLSYFVYFLVKVLPSLIDRYCDHQQTSASTPMLDNQQPGWDTRDYQQADWDAR